MNPSLEYYTDILNRYNERTFKPAVKQILEGEKPLSYAADIIELVNDHVLRTISLGNEILEGDILAYETARENVLKSLSDLDNFVLSFQKNINFNLMRN